MQIEVGGLGATNLGRRFAPQEVYSLTLTLRAALRALLRFAAFLQEGPSGDGAEHLNDITQPGGKFIAAVQWANAGRSAGEDHVARFQGEGLADFAE